MQLLNKSCFIPDKLLLHLYSFSLLGASWSSRANRPTRCSRDPRPEGNCCLTKALVPLARVPESAQGCPSPPCWVPATLGRAPLTRLTRCPRLRKLPKSHPSPFLSVHSHSHIPTHTCLDKHVCSHTLTCTLTVILSYSSSHRHSNSDTCLSHRRSNIFSVTHICTHTTYTQTLTHKHCHTFGHLYTRSLYLFL